MYCFMKEKTPSPGANNSDLQDSMFLKNMFCKTLIHTCNDHMWHLLNCVGSLCQKYSLHVLFYEEDTKFKGL